MEKQSEFDLIMGRPSAPASNPLLGPPTPPLPPKQAPDPFVMKRPSLPTPTPSYTCYSPSYSPSTPVTPSNLPPPGSFLPLPPLPPPSAPAPKQEQQVADSYTMKRPLGHEKQQQYQQQQAPPPPAYTSYSPSHPPSPSPSTPLMPNNLPLPPPPPPPSAPTPKQQQKQQHQQQQVADSYAMERPLVHEKQPQYQQQQSPPPPAYTTYSPSHPPSPSPSTPLMPNNLPLPPPPPNPPNQRLRPVRSATNLSGAHPPQQSGFVDPSGNMQVNFVVDEVPPKSPSGSTYNPATYQENRQGQQEIRRVKSSSALSTATSTTTTQDSGIKNDSGWKSALGEAQYFAGGLISHPSESTKHFTIIRHSHALVWYRGPETSVPITILSDETVPADRKLWLQQKGYSGNMGMSLKTMMGTNSDWIDVTPATKAAVEHIPATDERAIQRDFNRFEKKASGRQKTHIPRETHIVRIPAAATDGYFRLVLCSGDGCKKILCSSPVFRIASTSTEASSVKGASFSTMPIELGVKVTTTIANQVVKKYTGVVGAVASKGASKLSPSNIIVKKAASSAFEKSGFKDAVNDSWQKGKAGRFDPIVRASMYGGPVAVIGTDEGPEDPFPQKFDGRVVPGSGVSGGVYGIPTANLGDVPDAVKMRMAGVFAAWARIVPKPGLGDDVSYDWHEAVVTIAPLRNAQPGVVLKNGVAVHFIHDFAGTTFYEARVKVIIMGYLHPFKAHGTEKEEETVETHTMDVMTTVTSLGRENWGPEETLTRMKTLKSQESFTDNLNGVTSKVQEHVDRLPLHLVGVRSESGTMRDLAYGTGGLWVPR